MAGVNGEKGYDSEYFKGLLSEKIEFKYDKKTGKTTGEWKKIYDRNEPLDCRNYATAAMEILNPNFDWLAEQLEGGKAITPQAAKAARGKRVLSRGVS